MTSKASWVALLLPVWILPAFFSAKTADWPSFRGSHAAGWAEGWSLPLRWNISNGEKVLWKTRIPGLAHSSAIVFGDRVFVTSVLSRAGQVSFRPGLYGDGDASQDRSVQQWKVFCLDKTSGKILWERVAYEGAPREKRHMKATYANSTPVTDGRHLVAFFGSQGVYAFNLSGDLIWKRDLGRLDVGAYDAPDYEWGTATSPIIYQGRVILQVDTQAEDYLLALDIKDGETVWKTERDELPSWGTPTVCPSPAGDQIVTNGANFIRGYDAATGKEIWRLGGSSKITAPTPVFSGNLIVVASGRRPEAPIFVIRTEALGEITLPAGESSSGHVVWSRRQRGSYMPTPLIYRGYLYVLQNNGILDCYELETGREIYRRRLPHQGSGFSASPVAGDGKLYLSSEDGDVFVVQAAPDFSILAQNATGELLMATPALSEGIIYIRAQHHLIAVGER